MPATEADLALMQQAARAAAEIALGHWRRDHAVWEKDAGQGPVTEADLAVDRLLRDTLLAARPDHGWLSEETADDPARLSRRRVFVVDPIDGTRAYTAGEPSWAHSIALVEDGAVVAGVVHLPALGRSYSALAGRGAWRDGQRIRASGRDGIEGARVLTARQVLAPKHWRGPPPGLRTELRPSLAWRLALVAEGRFDGALTLRPSWEWDIAAGALIVTEAGATVTDRRGGALRFNTPGRQAAGLIAGAAALVQGLAAALA